MDEIKKFSVGDLVRDSKGTVLMVTDVLKDSGKYVYECNDGKLHVERELSLYN